jgi:hypothetical protein
MMLARHWSIVQIGEVKSQKFEHREIRNKEFRENLAWAVTVPGDRKILQQFWRCLQNLQIAVWPSTDTSMISLAANLHGCGAPRTNPGWRNR